METVDFGDFKWSPDDNKKYEKENTNSQQPRREFKPSEPSVKILYTDGGSRILNTSDGKRYIGAWSFYDAETNEIFGKAEDNATNNQMELLAAIRAIEYLNNNGVPKDKWVTIYTDSNYVRFGILFWTKNWIKNNWMKVDKDGKMEPVKNKELWESLYELSSERKIYWLHVPGHSGDEGNEKVDINCGILMDQFIKNAGIEILKKQ
jgi:ribonuclease HI